MLRWVAWQGFQRKRVEGPIEASACHAGQPTSGVSAGSASARPNDAEPHMYPCDLIRAEHAGTGLPSADEDKLDFSIIPTIEPGPGRSTRRHTKQPLAHRSAPDADISRALACDQRVVWPSWALSAAL